MSIVQFTDDNGMSIMVDVEEGSCIHCAAEIAMFSFMAGDRGLYSYNDKCKKIGYLIGQLVPNTLIQELLREHDLVFVAGSILFVNVGSESLMFSVVGNTFTFLGVT